MTTKHQVTDRNGRVFKRTSVNRKYSHAVVIHYAAIPPETKTVTSTNGRGEQFTETYDYRGRAAYSKAEWASTRELAENVARRAARCGDEFEVIAAEVV